MSSRIVTTEDERTRLEMDFDPAPVARAFIEDPTMITGYFGPLGCGKTVAGGIKTFCYGQSWPGARVAVIRDTWPNLRETTQKTFFDWMPDGIAGHYEVTKKTFNLYTAQGKPAEILFIALDREDDVKKVLSLDLAAAWIDEPQGGLALKGKEVVSEVGIAHQLFLSLVGRLGRQKGYPPMLWMTGNPPDPQHWIAREFQYNGKGAPRNPREKYRLYLGDKETNRRHLRHHFVGTHALCDLCGEPQEIVGHKSDYYDDLREIFGDDTAMAARFIDGLWVSFANIKPFREEWILYYDTPPAAESLYTVLGIDPAISKSKEACMTALTVVGSPTEGPDRTSIYTLAAVADRWSPYETAQAVFNLVRQHHVRKIRLEKVAYQEALAHILEREAPLQGLTLPQVELVPALNDKLIRAMGVSPLIESGRVLFGRQHQALVAALLRVPEDKSAWDRVDSFGLAVTGIPKFRARSMPLAAGEGTAAKRRAMSYAVRLNTGHAESSRTIPLSGGGVNQRLRQRAKSYAPRLT